MDIYVYLFFKRNDPRNIAVTRKSKSTLQSRKIGSTRIPRIQEAKI